MGILLTKSPNLKNYLFNRLFLEEMYGIYINLVDLDVNPYSDLGYLNEKNIKHNYKQFHLMAKKPSKRNFKVVKPSSTNTSTTTTKGSDSNRVMTTLSQNIVVSESSESP